jgi:hypothetical protein
VEYNEAVKESFLRSSKGEVGQRWGTIEKILYDLVYEIWFLIKKRGGETD